MSTQQQRYIITFLYLRWCDSVLNKHRNTPHNKSARHQEHGKGSYNCLYDIIAAHAKEHTAKANIISLHLHAII